MQPPAGSQVSRVPAQRSPYDPTGPAPATPAPPPQRRRVGRVLAVIAGVLALLCLGGAAVGFLFYDRATAPDRSAPDVVVDNYLRAFLVDRNDTRSNLFTCPNSTEQLADLKSLRSDLQAREQRFDTTLSVKWGSLDVQMQGNTAEVQVDLIISAYVDGVSQSDRQAWRFKVRLDDDWRVCGGSKA